MSKRLSLWLLCLALFACETEHKPQKQLPTEQEADTPEAPNEEKEAARTREQEKKAQEIRRITPFAPRFVQATASPTAATLASKSNDFGFRFYATLKNEQENAGKNLFFSPISLHALMSMVYLGATNRGEQELERVLALQGIPNLPKEYYNLQGSILKGVEGKAELALANAMFIKELTRISSTYQENISINFETAFFKSSSGDSKIVEKINNWAKEQTRGAIPQIIGGLDENVEMVLLNALYFKALWEKGYEFEEGRGISDGDFNLANGKTVKTPFMVKHELEFVKYRYFENAQFALLAIPYTGKQANLYIVLPAKGVPLESLEGQFSETNLQFWIAQMQERQALAMMMPKIKMKTDIKADALLKKMGVRRVFDGDLDKISGDLRLGRVVQKASLNIDEWGTVAAAVSEAEEEKKEARAAKGFTFIADRPFFFFIREEKMKSILFMGRVMNPAQE